jgi:hypothetical protein
MNLWSLEGLPYSLAPTPRMLTEKQSSIPPISDRARGRGRQAILRSDLPTGDDNAAAAAAAPVSMT